MTHDDQTTAAERQLPYSSAHAIQGVCRRLAPEDVAPGQYVTVLVRHHDAFRHDERTGRLERQRIAVLPEIAGLSASPGGLGATGEDAWPLGPAGLPLVVLAVALPFVIVRRPGVPGLAPHGPPPGEGPPVPLPVPVLTLDLRQVELAEVGQAYARALVEALAPPPPVEEAREAPAQRAGDHDRPERPRGLARRFRVARWRE